MRITIQRYKTKYWTGFLKRKPVFVLALHVILSEEELAAIKQRNLYDLPFMDRPYHELWGDYDTWKEIQALPVGLLVHLHHTQRALQIGLYHNDFDAEAGERQLRRGLEALKAVIAGSQETDRIDEFEL
jgi:hypothetical protein